MPQLQPGCEETFRAPVAWCEGTLRAVLRWRWDRLCRGSGARSPFALRGGASGRFVLWSGGSGLFVLRGGATGPFVPWSGRGGTFRAA